MSKPERKKHFSFSYFRRRQMAANDRKFYTMWINKMVKKQVEKHIVELHAEFSLLSQELREQMAAEIMKHQREPVVEEARECLQHYTVMHKEEKDEEKPLNQIPLSNNSTETHCYTNHIYMKSTKWEADDNFRILLNDLTDSDSRETVQVSLDAHRSSQQAEKQLMETQWNEWMDNQEKIGNLKANPRNQRNTEKQEAGPCKPEKPLKEITEAEPTNTMKKIRTCISDFFDPYRHYMWKKLEEDD